MALCGSKNRIIGARLIYQDLGWHYLKAWAMSRFTTVYINIGSYHRPPPLSGLWTDTTDGNIHGCTMCSAAVGRPVAEFINFAFDALLLLFCIMLLRSAF